MFKTDYIYELTSRKLSNEGYKHFISVVSYFVRKYNWPKSIILNSKIKTTEFWTAREIKKITHQFFEWAITKGKFDNINKIPENYLSYYFAQILISFISNQIKEEQLKEGLSYEKFKELVISICKEDYIINTIQGTEYVFIHSFSKKELKPIEDVTNKLSYLSKIPIKKSTKHFRPLVKLAMEDIFNFIETPISINKLTEAVYSLFDQKDFNFLGTQYESINEDYTEKISVKYDKVIQNIVSVLTKDDAKMISHFLFHNEEREPLAEIAEKYNIPKSTFLHKVDSFKKKIVNSYTPKNEQDGIFFIQNISRALDKLSK